MRVLRPWQIIGGALALVLIGVIAWRLFGGQTGEPAAPAPAAVVTLSPVRASMVNETVTAYGTAQGSAATNRNVSVARAVIVERVLVGPGQTVNAGTPVAVVGDAPSSTQAYRQAADAVTFAARDLARVQRMAAEKLASNDQVTAAQKALADARAALAGQAASGAGRGRQTLTSPFAGVVVNLPIAAGDHVAADAPLMSLASASGLVAQMGVEPQDVARLAAGLPVTLTPVFDRGRQIASRLTVVTHQVDATSRMVSVAAPVNDPTVPVGAALEGAIVVASRPGLLVPRAAVVFDENGAHLFVVRAGAAHQVAVTAGPEQGEDIAVSGAIKAGDAVAVEGAYELQDGMAVRAKGR